MVSSVFGWASYISIVKTWLCYGEGGGKCVTICICECSLDVKPKTILKPTGCNNHCFIRDCRTRYFTRSIYVTCVLHTTCNVQGALCLVGSRVERVRRLEGALIFSSQTSNIPQSFRRNIQRCKIPRSNDGFISDTKTMSTHKKTKYWWEQVDCDCDCDNSAPTRGFVCVFSF